MSRKISGHDGDLVVNDAVELDGDVTGGLVVEPGGSVVIRGSAGGNAVSVGGAQANAAPDEHQLDGDLGNVISDIP